MATNTSMAVPDAKAAPKEGKLPSHFTKRNNLAGDKDLCNAVLGYISERFENFKTRDARKKFVDKGGVMDNADRAWRVALNRDTSSAQYQNSLSDVASSVFHRAIRSLTAGENAVFFQGEALPARYEVNLNTDDYTPQDGRALAEKRNLVRDYTWEKDDRRIKIKRGNLYKNKYGQQLWGIEWAFEKEKRKVKVQQPDGTIKRVEREVITKEWPRLCEYDVKDFYADAYINDIQDQRVTIHYFERGYEWLAMNQAQGHFMNVEKVSAADLNDGETDEQLEARRTNAGETPETQATGRLSVWECWARLPIKETGDGKGKIDRSQIPQWYWCTFSGGTRQNMSGATCLRIIKNPFDHGKLPYFMDYAYHDDKGMYHVAPWNLVESAYWQVVTNYNQAIDNVTLRNRAPYIADGPIRTRDLTFLANKVIKVAKGTTLSPITVQDTTQITMQMADRLEQEIKDALGITQTIEGTPLGGRTSAAEASNDLDQAQKPLMQKADENGQAFYGWLMEMDAELWDQFARPDLSLVVSHQEQTKDVIPAEMYGPIKVKVTAVTEFENTTTQRREINAFIQGGGYDRAAEIMPVEAKSLWWRQTGERLGFKRVAELFPPVGDRDSLRRASEESWAMLNGAEFIAAEEGENHSAHLGQHESFLHEAEFVPELREQPEIINNLRAHIEQHKAMQSQQASQRQTENIQGGSNAAVASNELEAAAGAQANLG